MVANKRIIDMFSSQFESNICRSKLWLLNSEFSFVIILLLESVCLDGVNVLVKIV